jgi:hypothetical protein
VFTTSSIESKGTFVRTLCRSMQAIAHCAFALLGVVTQAQATPASDANAFGSVALTRSGFVRVGHDDIVVDPTVRRYTGQVVSMSGSNAKGQVYTFKTMALGPRSFPLTHDDLRGWRLTVLSGKRFGQVFTVSTNTESEITVTDDKGPLDGFDAPDVFIIESIDANGASMFAPPGTIAPAASPGA